MEESIQTILDEIRRNWVSLSERTRQVVVAGSEAAALKLKEHLEEQQQKEPSWEHDEMLKGIRAAYPGLWPSEPPR